MKKLLIIVFTAVFFTSVGFAGEKKLDISLAYNSAHFTERNPNSVSEIKANGLDCSALLFFNKNWGAGINVDFIFPSKMNIISKGSTMTVTSSDWNRGFILSSIIAPSFKYSVYNNLDFTAILGVHGAWTSFTSKDSALNNFSFGIGGDLGLRFRINDIVSVAGGTIITHDFVSLGNVMTTEGKISDKGAYNLGSFRPYVGITFVIPLIKKDGGK